MKPHVSLSVILVLCLGLTAATFAQSQSQQPQSPDPTAQSRAAPPQSTPPTFPPTQASPQEVQHQQSDASGAPADSERDRTFLGTILKGSYNDYVLRAGDVEYKLDDQSTAKKYEGKDVSVLGRFDKQNNMIHVERIETSPLM